jgi:predicted TPR repeat methyltransferase
MPDGPGMGKLSSTKEPDAAPGLSGLLRQASAAHQAGRLHEAEALCKLVLNADARQFDALHRLAIIQSQFGRAKEALAYYDKAVAILPSRADAHNNRGMALQELERFEDALASHDKALAIRPDSAEIMTSRAAALHGLRRFEEALAGYDRALALQPRNVDALYNRGNTLGEMKRFAAALASYDKALAIQPQSAEALNNRGNSLKALRRFDEALASYDRAVAIKPDYAVAHSNAGATLIECSRFDEAIARFRRALTLRPDLADARVELGLALARQGRLEEAAAEARAAARLAGQSLFPRYSFGTLLAKCGMKAEASAQFKLCLAADPDDRQGARMFLAGLGQESMPERAPDALLGELYSSNASTWDQCLTGAHPYRGAELVGRAIERLANESKELDVLDVGCGTGLAGPLLRPRARCLDGIDLSPAMLEMAKEKKIYDTLQQGDLVALLADRADRYDVVTAAGTLIHFGDLRPVFEAVASALRDAGLFVFTVFPNDDDDNEFTVGAADGLLQCGCYVHGRGYVARTAEATGFAVEILDREVHEYNHGQPRFGLVVALRRCPRSRTQGP